MKTTIQAAWSRILSNTVLVIIRGSYASSNIQPQILALIDYYGTLLFIIPSICNITVFDINLQSCPPG